MIPWRRHRARLVRGAACLALFALALAAHALTAARITDATYEAAGARSHVTLPFTAPSTPKGPLVFRAHLVAGIVAPRSIVVVPDDRFLSLAIDGREVDASSVPKSAKSDYRRGFSIPVAAYVHPGSNDLVARVANGDGPGGLDLEPDARDPSTLTEDAVGLAGLCGLLAEVLLALGVGWPTVAVAVLAVVVRAAYLAVTPYDVRHHDALEHLEYVEFLVAHHALPQPEAGYMFYHPPLYYLSCALAWAGLRGLGAGRAAILFALQLLSVACELGFAVLAIAAARLWMRKAPAAAWGRGVTSEAWASALLAALVLLWPSSIVHAVRVGNDDMAYLFFGASLYFTSRFWLGGADRDARWSALAAALGVVTKTNDVLGFAVLLLAVAARLVFVDRERRLGAYVRRGWLPAAAFVVSVAAAFGTAVRDRLAGHRPNLLIANFDINSPKLIVGDHVKNFVWFDLPGFLTHPFTSAWDDARGRQWFLNYLLKTSLFGEFSYSAPWLTGLATVASALLLALVVLLVAGLVLAKGRGLWDELPLALALGLSFVALAALRAQMPRACSGDFRYVLPVIGPCAYFTVRGVGRMRERGARWAAVAGAAVGWALVATSVAFFFVLMAVRD